MWRIKKKHKGLYLEEIAKITWKSLSACKNYIYRNKDTRTLEVLKLSSRKTSAQKHFVEWLPVKQWCEENNVCYKKRIARYNREKKLINK